MQEKDRREEAGGCLQGLRDLGPDVARIRTRDCYNPPRNTNSHKYKHTSGNSFVKTVFFF